MKALTFVWGFIAFSILGLDFLPKTATFYALQDFESNFEIVDYPEDFLPNWSATAVRNTSSRIYQAIGEGVAGSCALGIQVVSSFNAEIYIKTTTKDLNSNIFSLKAKTKRNGSGNRPVSVFFSFSFDGHNFTNRQQIGDDQTFKNEDGHYEAYEAEIPEPFFEKDTIVIKLEVTYGAGSGSAARLFIDDFAVHGLERQASEPLRILSTESNHGKILIVRFNQPIALHAEDPPELNQGYGGASNVRVEEDTLFLEFADHLYSNVYQISLDNLASLTTGETWNDTTYIFEIIAPTPPGAVRINEFMADPNPKGSVPEDPVLPQGASHEYIELFNATDKSVRLKGFSYNGGFIDDRTLEPGGYALITSSSSLSMFSSFGNVTAAQPFTSLANTSGEIVISDAFGNVVDSLTYSQDWHDSPQKRAGGWALERVDPFLPCSDSDNWKSSISSQGGTPGRVNSVFSIQPDDRPFVVLAIRTLSMQELQVSFSKAIPTNHILDAIFTIDGEKVSSHLHDGKTVLLTFYQGLISGEAYQLRIEKLFDCSGRGLVADSYVFVYDGEGPEISRIGSMAPDELLVYFNEALPSNVAEEASRYQINQNNDLVTSAALLDSATVHLVLKRGLEINRRHIFSARGLQDLQGNVSSQLEAEFILDDQLDTVEWAGANLLDLYFHTPIESASASITSNFFVDKTVGYPARTWVDNQNTRLVHLVFDQNLPVNTNLTLTAQNLRDTLGNYINSHKKTLLFDDRAIAISTLHISDDTTLHLRFNKPLHPAYASLTGSYVIDKAIGHPLSVDVIQPDAVVLTLNPLVEGNKYTLSVSGLQDIYGIKMNRTINRDFTFDTSGPAVLEAYLVSPDDIHVETNEAVTLPDQVWINGKLAEVKALAANKLMISSPQQMTENLIRLTFSSLTDLYGNRTESLSVDIPNDQVKLGSAFIIKEDLIQLVFTQKMDPARTALSTPYLINGRRPKAVVLQENQFEVGLLLSHTLPLLDSATVEIEPLVSALGKDLSKSICQLWYDDQVEDLYFVNAQLIQLVHSKALDKEAAENVGYHLKDQDVQIQPIINQTDTRLLQLALSPAISPNIVYDLVLPPREDHGKNAISGSIRRIVYDRRPPALTAIEAINECEIIVSFDEALDPVLALVPSYYQLNGKEPVEVIPAEQAHQVILVYDMELAKGSSYLLTVKQLEDLHRNAIEEDSLEFRFDGPIAPAYKDIIINEIMAAPKAGQALPEVEFVELFNSSQNTIALGGLVFANSRSSAVLPRASLPPGGFVLLTAHNQEKTLEKFGFTLGLSSWPTLLNGEDELRLLDRQGNLLDHTQYTLDSYGGPEFAQGGYSLERVNPFAICQDTEELKPSESSSRGTPGQVNSVFDPRPDQERPVLQKAVKRGEQEVILLFSKRLNDDLSKVKITFSPAADVDSFGLEENNPNWLTLTLQEPLKENTPYKISVENLRDCPGNEIDPKANFTTLLLPIKAQEGDIVLNEILFNAQNNYPKFVEIYNKSANYIDVQGWSLANLANDEVANRRRIAEEQLIIAPFSFLVFTTDASLLKQAYPRGKEETFVELSSLPSYPQARGTVIFLEPEENFLERFDYDEKFHHSLLEEVRGVSLERLLVSHPTNDPKNWHSASATSGYATPGYKNSHAQGEGLLEKGITVSPEVFVPDAPGEQNFTTISYQMERAGLVATLRIYDVSGQLVKELCQNDVWGSSGFYTWDGTNLSGSKVRPGYYIVWTEILNLEGRVENIKKTVVVGTKF